MGHAMNRSDRAGKDASEDPDARLESDLQADPALREGPVPLDRRLLLVIGGIVILALVWWALVAAR